MECREVLYGAVFRVLKELDVSLASYIMWRDSVSDSTIMKAFQQEIPKLCKVLQQNRCNPTLTYVVYQKHVVNKFLIKDGTKGIHVGALINKLQGPNFDMFYINGSSPPYSTPKPVPFVICNKDNTFALTHIRM